MIKRSRKVRISISLDKVLLKAIDQVRGPIPRSSFIQLLIEEGLRTHNKRRPKNKE